MNQAEVATLITSRLPHRPLSEDSVSRVEQGVPVEASVLWPILLAVGLHEPPSLAAPRPGQSPGDWVRDLRESYRIAPKAFCFAALYSGVGLRPRRLTYKTLMRIETGDRLPDWSMMPALAGAFGHFGLSVDVLTLDRAFQLGVGPELDQFWGPAVRAAKARSASGGSTAAAAAAAVVASAAHDHPRRFSPSRSERGLAANLKFRTRSISVSKPIKAPAQALAKRVEKGGQRRKTAARRAAQYERLNRN